MSEKKGHILVVDDSPDSIFLLIENLKDDYAVVPAKSGKEGLIIAANTPKPDVILLDVEMPEMDGYEVCRNLKANPETQDIDVIFITSHDTTEEKLLGYEAGGSDYVIKPIDPRELNQKVAVSIANKQKRSELEVEKDNVMLGFMEALTSYGEQGVIIEFLRKSFSIESIEDLAQLLIDAIKEYQLSSSVQIRALGEVVYKSSTEQMSPLEKELLSRLKDQGKILEYKQRMFVNHESVSLFIKSIPDDEMIAGRMRDNLVLLTEGANARVKQMEMNQKEEIRRNGMKTLMDDSQQELLEMIKYQKEHLNTTVSLLDDLLQDLEASFLSWGLSEEQEETLLRIVESGINRALGHIESGEKAEIRFKQLIEKFAKYA